MSELPHQTPGLTAVDTGQDSRPDDPTRRNVIAGAAAATAVAVAAPTHAQGTDADRINMVLFVLLSGALTGIAENKLAPGFAISLVSSPPPRRRRHRLRLARRPSISQKQSPVPIRSTSSKSISTGSTKDG